MSTRYFVYFTPRIGAHTYGTQVDVSDYIDIGGIDNIVSSIDSTDYDVGVFTYGDIQLKAINQDGYFNDENDYRSLFRFSRDLCKVEIHFVNEDGDMISFHGIINDEATVINAETNEIDFRVLSRDSIIRTANIAGGVITNGSTVKSALENILNVPDVTSVLTFNAANINPSNNFIIDDGSKFDNVPLQEGLNQLLLTSNSVMIVDEPGNIYVRDRTPDPSSPIKLLFGPYDIQRRQNVINIFDFNTGKQRMFNSIKVNTTEKLNASLVESFGFRQKQLTLDFVTDLGKEASIATALLQEFAVPKKECKVTIPTSIGRGMKLLDLVSVNWPLRIAPIGTHFLPLIGITKVGEVTEPLPYVFGSFEINRNTGWKVIEITENAKSFEMTLKLRQIGKNLDDGVFNIPTSQIVGFAVIGLGTIGVGSTDPWNPSVVGAGLVGATRVS